MKQTIQHIETDAEMWWNFRMSHFGPWKVGNLCHKLTNLGLKIVNEDI